MTPQAQAILALFDDSAPDGVVFNDVADTLNGVGIDDISEDEMNALGTSVFTFMTFLNGPAEWVRAQDVLDPRYEAWVRLSGHCGVVLESNADVSDADPGLGDSNDPPDGQIVGLDLDAIDDPSDPPEPPSTSDPSGPRVGVAQGAEPSNVRRRRTRDAADDHGKHTDRLDHVAAEHAAARARMFARANHRVPDASETDSQTRQVLLDRTYVGLRDRAWRLIEQFREEQITPAQFKSRLTRLRRRIVRHQGEVDNGFGHRAQVVHHLLRFIRECLSSIDETRPEYFQAYFYEAGAFND